MAYDEADDIPILNPGGHFQRKARGNTTLTTAPPLIAKTYTNVEERFEAMHQDGFVVFKNAIPKDQVAHVKQIMSEQPNGRESDYSDWGYGKDGERREDIRFLQKAGPGVCGSPDLLPYINIPEVMELLELLLGKHFHIVGGVAWITGPGRYPMGLHSDWQIASLPEDIMADPRVRLPMYECFAHFYLNDMSEDIGPTIIVPGSHRSGRIPDNETSWNGTEAQSFCCEAGDMILFTNSIWHGALPNISDEDRYLLQIQYANMRIGTVSNRPLKVADDVIAQANEEQLRLLGKSEQKYNQYY